MKSEVEELLKACKPHKQEHKGNWCGAEGKSTNAKLIKFPITKYDGDPLRWLEFWQQLDTAVHSRELENIIKFSYLRENLTGKAAAAIRGILSNQKITKLL